jgi:hypothetical protein
MGRSALAAAWDMEGAFNEVSFTLAPGASIDDVFARVDRVLGAWGGTGAYGRADQPVARAHHRGVPAAPGDGVLLPSSSSASRRSC